MSDGENLARFLRSTGWRVGVYEDGARFVAYAERHADDGGGSIRLTGSGVTQADATARLFEQACEHVYGTRPTFEEPPETPIDLLH
jgi:uncharacterized protein YbjT (DUF2867 family)